MTAPVVKSFATLVDGQSTAVQASASGLVDTSVGSVLRAFLEASSQVGLWLQGLILNLLTVTRASTSTGTDLDTWVADFGLTRTPSAAALGVVTLSRFTSTGAAYVAPGGEVQTGDGSQVFTIGTDTDNPNWNSGHAAYKFNIGVSSIDVPVVAQKAGRKGNVLAGTISTVGSAMVGVDTVTNALDFSGGANPEADRDLRVRFIAYLSSLSKSTVAAVSAAIAEVQAGLNFLIVENLDPDGTPHPGHFYVVLDDGTGFPPDSLLEAVAAAIELVRPVSVTYEVVAPVVQTIDVDAAVNVRTVAQQQGLAARLTTVVSDYIDNLRFGRNLVYGRLEAAMYEEMGEIGTISSLLIDGDIINVIVPDQNLVKPGTINVTVTVKAAG